MMTPERWRNTASYLCETFGREDSTLAALREAARARGLPDIAVTAEVGRLLELLVRTTAARTVVEVGTLGGYSAVWMARALAPGGRLITIEIDAERAALARSSFARAGLGDCIEVRHGAALQVLPGLVAELPPLDVVFLDAVKVEYLGYFQAVRHRIAPAGLVLADNALGASSWWIDDVGHPDREAMDEFNRTLVADATFDVAAVPVREGLLIARKRST